MESCQQMQWRECLLGHSYPFHHKHVRSPYSNILKGSHSSQREGNVMFSFHNYTQYNLPYFLCTEYRVESHVCMTIDTQIVLF